VLELLDHALPAVLLHEAVLDLGPFRRVDGSRKGTLRWGIFCPLSAFVVRAALLDCLYIQPNQVIAMKNLMTLYAVFCAAVIAAGVVATSPQNTPAVAASMSAAELKLDIRKLWEDHISYTRNYIISALGDLPDAKSVAKRLLKNQDEIGQAIVPLLRG
jgi:hypothetical protein